MDESPYTPSQSGLAAGLASDQEALGPTRARFGPFSFSRVFELAGRGLQRNLGPSIGLYALLFLMIVAAGAACCVGWVFALPHLLAGASLMGYYMVRGDLTADHVFAGFRRYGTVLVACAVFGIAYVFVYAVFGGPYHLKLLSVFSKLDPGLGSDSSWEGLLKRLSAPEVGSYRAFSYVAVTAGAYLTGRWLLALPLIVERGYGAFESLAVSWRVTRPHQWWLLLLVLLSNMISFAGMFVCGIGVFVSYPLGMALQGGALVQLLGDVLPEAAGGDTPQPADSASFERGTVSESAPSAPATGAVTPPRDPPARPTEENPYG